MSTIAATPDNAFVRAEEPPSKSPALKQPTTLRERISSIDVLRGFALLGILIINIDDFGLYEAATDIPMGIPKPAFIGPHTHLNLVILILKWAFFDGKMRGIFSMLFGAGIVLMTTRAERRGAGSQIADIFHRRNMWLLLFGLLHGVFLWDGDILFYYALISLVVVYPLRKLQAKTLLLAGTFILLVLTSSVSEMLWTHVPDDIRLSRNAALVAADRAAGRAITPEQQNTEAQWNNLVKRRNMTAVRTQNLDKPREAYWTGVKKRLSGYIGPSSGISNFYALVEFSGLMMIGMGLTKNGFLTAERSYATYAWTAVVGYLLSVPLYIFGVLKAYASGFFFIDMEKWLRLPYFFALEAGALATAAIVMITVKSGFLRPVQHALAAVGQTALTNYLLTTVLCQFIFLWGPWKLFGKLEYYQLEYVMLFVWAINLIASSLWLRIFQFGPVEWLWRSLTYVKLQPMLNRRSA